MIFGILTLLIALAIAGVAAWFSIIGLMAIFSASATSIAIMAGVLEVGKLVAASWLYRHWKETSILMKSYLTAAVLVLMLITSMGIFGYLSKAHLDQSAVGGNNELKMAQITQRIDRQQRKVIDANTVLAQLDQSVQTLIDYDRIRGPSGAIAVRESQADERAKLNAVIDSATDQIALYQEELLPLQQDQLQVELKVGPLKYVAELIYGESDETVLDKAVRLFILLLVVVFDPLAIVMILAANQTLIRHGVVLEKQYEKLGDAPLDSTPFDMPTASPTQPDTELQDDLNNLMEILAQKDRRIQELVSAEPTVVEKEVIKTVEVPVEVVKEVTVEVEKIVPEVRYEKVPVEIQVETVKEVEKIVEVPVETIKEVEVPVEVIKEVTVEVEKEVIVDNPEKLAIIEQLEQDALSTEKAHALQVQTLERKISRLSGQLKKAKTDAQAAPTVVEVATPDLEAQEKINQLNAEVERLIQERNRAEKEEIDELRKTAIMLSHSEFNKEDLSEEEMYDILVKSSSDEEVQKKLDFLAVPLPKKLNKKK